MLEWLAHWHNWPFLVALMVGMGLVGLTLLGFSKDFDHGVDLNGDGVPDVSKPDMEQGHLGVFAVLGVGKVPLSILIEVLLISFGLSGLLVNAVAHDLLSDWGVLAFPVALVAGVMGSMFTTRVVAQVISKFAPADVPTSRRPGEFVGSGGTAASLITAVIGQVRVVPNEKTQPEALLNVCLDPEWKDNIQRGTEVYLSGYDPERSLYLVRPLLTD